jgi:hypothetical protein
MNRDRQGCLSGILQLFLLTTFFDWMQNRFGFGKGCSCTGLGCGIVLLFVFFCFACSIVTGTNWFDFRF